MLKRQYAQHLVRLSVGSRDSLLARKQVEEVEREFRLFFPTIFFNPIFVKSTGDLHKNISLRTLDKTDFFTKEIDQMVLEGKCDIGIHSAKDLPDPLTKGLDLFALTKGIDSRDALVLREGEHLETLKPFSTIATSSLRREEEVRKLRSELCFVDIRGTIEERLHKVFSLEIDGVVIAEAALIRLGLTHLNRWILPGETAQYQGRLAVIGKEGNDKIKKLFTLLHHR